MILYVVDASVAAKWFLQESDSALARTFLDRSFGQLLAPDLIQAEVSNILWRKSLHEDLGAEAAMDAARRLPEYFQELALIGELTHRSLAIALELRHPVYDCFYLALSEQRSAPLVTADKRLHGIVQGTSWAVRTQLLA